MDPAAESTVLEEPQSWNRYSYVLNRPTVAIDPTGEISYFVSRPLGDDPDSKYAHTFIVTHAKYPGDPDARVKSFGQTDTGKMGRVDHNTTNDFSDTTHQSDIDAWNSLGGQAAPGVDYAAIPATDSDVESFADAVMENQDYAAASGPFGVNSNSAAQAVANSSSGTTVPAPGERKPHGSGNSPLVQFDRDNDGQPD